MSLHHLARVFSHINTVLVCVVYADTHLQHDDTGTGLPTAAPVRARRRSKFHNPSLNPPSGSTTAAGASQGVGGGSGLVNTRRNRASMLDPASLSPSLSQFSPDPDSLANIMDDDLNTSSPHQSAATHINPPRSSLSTIQTSGMVALATANATKQLKTQRREEAEAALVKALAQEKKRDTEAALEFTRNDRREKRRDKKASGGASTSLLDALRVK